MTSTPVLNSAMQQRPHKGAAAIVVLSQAQGELMKGELIKGAFIGFLGSAPVITVITGRTKTLTKGRLWDRSTSGWWRQNLAPT